MNLLLTLYLNTPIPFYFQACINLSFIPRLPPVEGSALAFFFLPYHGVAGTPSQFGTLEGLLVPPRWSVAVVVDDICAT